MLKKLRITNYELRISLISCVMLFSLFDIASAQLRKTFVMPTATKDTSSFWIFKDVTAGPYFTAGISRENEDLPGSSSTMPWQSSPRFFFCFTPVEPLILRIIRSLGFDFSLLYDSRDLYADTTGASIDMSLGYLSFQPSIRFFWLLLGFSFDIPMSGSAIENITSYQRPSGDQPHI